MTRIRIIIQLLLSIIIQSSVLSTTIHYVTTSKNGERGKNQGSIEGGTLIWIRGEGFLQDAFDTTPTTDTLNKVQLVRDYLVYDCNVYVAEMTDTRLPCYTVAMPPGDYIVRVYVKGNLIPIKDYTALYDANGSIQGGTMLTISGQYFSNSSQYPLVVNVGNEPCTILNVNSTTIQCQTSPVSNNNRTHYHGGRGLHLFSENVFTNFSNSQNSTHRMPNNNANKTWISEASFISNNVASTTIWLIGYLRPPKTATFTFLLDTNVNSVLYLSTDDKPENRILIANNNSPRSKEILLQNNTNYYLFCMGSTQRGSFRLTIKVKMHDGKTVVGNSNNLGTAEIQRINVGSGSVQERQRITYSDAYVDEVAETQDIVALSVPFQIGFRGAYTVLLVDPELLDVEMALNDLPTIYPLKVTVALALASFRITFPTDMGDVPLLTIISSAYNIPQNATEIIQGVASGSKLAFQLEDQTTQYLDLSADFLTNAILEDQFEELFNIQCPPSLYTPDADSSIVHVEEFETLTTSNGVSPMTNTVFCGRKAALVNNYQNLITDNSELADYMCFAYKLPNGIESLRLYMRVESDKNFDMYTSDNIVTSISLISDTYWHYTCLDLREILEAYSLEYFAASVFVIKNVYLGSESNGVLIDTVTLRTSKPFKYENEYLLDMYDQSSSCTFPFYYNGRNHTRCILNDEGLPICRSSTNAIHYCQRSSVEGIRRLYPKYQLLDNSISINHLPQNRTIDISFRYTECNSPSLIKAFPASHVNVTSITTASKPLYGTYDIEFNGQTYTSIPAVIDRTDMSNLLQFYANTGYNLVSRIGDCGSYSYTVTWLSKGKQPLIKIVNTNDVRPIGISINVSSIQFGADGDVFYNLPNDITRTYHNGTQVEVIIGDQSSYCSTVNNNCQFQYSIQQTPTIVSIVQNGIILRINGDGFRPSTELNIVVIGEQGLCTVTVANTTFLLCTIANAPSGQQIVRVNIADKGFALSNGNLLVNVPLSIASFNPNEGGVGGGYALTIYGNGFSSNSIVTIDGNLCSNSRVINFSSIICIVPSSKRISASQVIVSVIDNENSVNAASLFTYNATDTPIISSIVPTFTTMISELLNITGTGFGNSIDSVFVGTKSAKILSSSNTNIQIRLPELPPGLYPISMNTSKGPARSINPIEYRFYIEKIFPQIGSLYGGNDVYIYGNGFNNSTNIQFRTENNRLSPCNIISILSNKIHCQTTSFAQQITITADGVHPLYGSNFSWSSPHQVVQLGTIVTWIWNSSAIFLPRRYKIQQVMNAYSTQPSVNGFDSGIATTSGSYFYQFNSLGTFYYWSPMVDDAEVISLRGTIIVVPSESEIWHVEAISGQFTAQTCVFPFTFNSVNYTQCTSVNDTQLWCSPTSVYTGQRLYCASTNSSTNSTCPSNVFNGSLCNETVSQPIQFRSTLCTVGSVSSITPTEGIIGTLVTITGTGFDGDLCEYDIQFGASHHCPLINKTSNQMTCQITSNSMLDGSTSYAVRVLRYRQGYLRDEMSIRFNFLASISNITPMKGSIYGGTQVTIDGVGFIPGSTRVFLAEIDYTHLATITYSQIILTTPSQTYDLDRNINIYVGTNQVKCLIPSCSFQWTQRLTPYLDSVTPESIHGPTNLTILGRNLLAGNISYTDVQLSIAGSSCTVTGMTNDSLNCSITGIEAGTHQILGSINGIGNINSSANVTSEAILISSSPSSSSIYGNATLRIIGNGFSTNINNIKVMVGFNPCNVVRATGGEIQCTIPAHNGSSNLVAITVTSNGNQFSSSLSLQYDTSITPNIILLTANTNSVSTVLSISGSNFVTGYTNVHVGNYLCAIAQVTSVSITCTLSSQQSAGNHSVIVYVDNIGNSNSDIVYTYPLVLTNVSSTKGSYGGGLPVTIVGNGFNGNDISVNVCNQPLNHLCNLTVTVNGISENALFTYTANLTSTITSISPVQGGTGGGTIVTITGTGFPNSIQIVSVYIDDVICSILTINSTAIRCETGSHYQTNLKAAVRVYINDNGYAIGDVFFGYVDRWSSRWTWGGDQPPEACSVVSIEKGATVYLDQSTPILESLIIDNATLIFEDSKDIELRVKYIIIVNGGSLQIGTESNPFQHRAIITMYGHVRSRELPIFGAKVLAVHNGTLDMHGKSTVRTWTQLGATAINGSSTITLKQAVDWSIGNQIVIATTGDRLSQIESEVRRITNISSDNRTLTLDQPLQYTHLGIIHQLNTTTIEVRGEVGLLSHNIIFRGMPTDTTTGTIIENLVESNSDDLSGQTCWRIEAGQEFNSDQFGAIITASQETSIFGQTQLAVIRISNVELYNVGQGFRVGRYPIYFRQNGNMSESYVKSSSIHLSYNRAINIQASNYITLENNVIYDILGNGIVLNDGIEIGNVFRNNLVVFVRSSSTLFNEDFAPAAFWLSNPNNTLGQNAVAGCSHYGYWYRLLEQTDELPLIHKSTSLIGVWIYPLYQPTISGLRDDRIEYISSKMIQIKNALIFDNTDTGIACSTAVRYDEIDVNGLRSTFFNAENGSGIIDSIIIGDANISSEVIVPSTAGLIVIWGRGFLVQNVTFMNFLTNQTPAIIGPTLNDRCIDHCGGWTIKFYKMSFINVVNRARLRWQYDALFENSDRTLTDQNDSVIVMARDGLANTLPSCTPVSDFENAVQCSLSEGPWIRLALTENLNYRSSINSGPLTITDENNTTVNVSWYYEGLTYAQGYTMLLKVNKTYQFSYSNTLNWDNIKYLIALYDLAPGDYFIIQHRMAFKPNIALINESLTPLSGMNSTHEPQEYQNWNRTKPTNYQNIWVPWCYHLIIDCPLPTIRSLRIDGIVEFQQGRNHTMYIDSIIISEGGALIAGSQNNPFNGNIDIILTNNNSINAYLPFTLPSLQSRQIAVKGLLELHGLARNIVWTRLATTVTSGSNLFVLSESIDWSVGDEIIITTTDTDISHTERHRIASIINGTTIQTVNSLAYTHRVIRQIFPNGQSINIAAAVGLLTRTIRIKSNNGRTDPLGARIYIAPNTLYNGDNKGYAHLSHIQFINFGQFDGTTSSDYKKSGIYMQNSNTYNQNRLTNIYGCSFDGGFDAAITMRNTHSITIENNIIYNTYRSGIFVTGRNNVIRKNLLTTIYWTGTQNPSTASIDTNYDAAIMSDNSVSVIMQNNLVAGVERLAYRVQGDTCSVGNIPQDTINDFSNNEAHSTMAGVNIWPSDRGLVFDRQCVLIKKFIVYKAWYYGFYINTYRNITIDSCASIDNHVGIFTFIVGPAAETHVTVHSRVNIQNSIVTGSITPNDCDDKINFNSENIQASRIALPIVAPDSKNGRYGSRSGIVFPMVSKNNKMPAAPWTGTIHYPSLDGSMLIANVTLAFFNNTCGRHDIAIQASQSNDDIQFPITTKSIFKYNLSESNLIFNGEPNSEQIRAQDCGDMDCDGLKKILIVDTDGTCLNTPGSTFSISERYWGNAQRGTGYFQIPAEAYTTPSGIRFDISSVYPYTGIIRSSSCSLQDSWQMYRCDNTPDYRMLVIENMDRRNELGQFSPITIISDNGYIDLINGPQDYGECKSELCRRRLSTFMAIVQSGRTYQIYFKRYPIPLHLRFRLINADESIKCILAIYYNSMEHLDVYTNGIYTAPTNRDTSTSYLLLLDQPNRVNLTSQAGANYQDRTYQLAYFLINGDTTIDIKKASYFILNFGLPPVNESTFFLNDVARNFAAFFNIDPVKIRRVKIVRETGSNRSRSDQVSQTLVMELRNEPTLSSASSRDVNVEIMSNIVSTMMNSYQSGELNIAWKNRDFTGGVVPLYLTVQEPFNVSNVSLSIINRTELRIAPDDCREQSPCAIQPVLVAYDAEGNIIEKLGSIERPWQVKASIVNRPNLVLMGNVANYSDGQTQFRFLGLPSMGSFEILFTFVRPDGVTSSFFQKTNLTARSDAITVSDAILAGQQVNSIYVVNVNETFSISVTPVDSITRSQLGKIQWGNWTWIADAKLYTLPKYQHHGVLIKHNFSTTVVSVSASTVTLSGLVIDTPAMYILNIQLVSTNNQHSFTLASNGILVKDNESDSFVYEVDELLCNIVFKGDYNALSSSNQLEIKRAMIYNYLRSINMPMISDIVFVEGDLIAKFQVDAYPTNISQAVSSILSNPNAIPDLSISSVNINGRTFSILSNENTSTSDGNKTGLIIGIVIGLLAGTLLTIGGIWLYRKKSRKNDQLSSSEFLDIDDDEAAWRRKMKIVLPELETKIEQND
ncbi:hypothetical protein I4U23_012761 [Adineta vaga]|nr:hypothetical protein I4U23_012761 [Adineta vaga]